MTHSAIGRLRSAAPCFTLVIIITACICRGGAQHSQCRSGVSHHLLHMLLDGLNRHLGSGCIHMHQRRCLSSSPELGHRSDRKIIPPSSGVQRGAGHHTVLLPLATASCFTLRLACTRNSSNSCCCAAIHLKWSLDAGGGCGHC